MNRKNSPKRLITSSGGNVILKGCADDHDNEDIPRFYRNEKEQQATAANIQISQNHYDKNHVGQLMNPKKSKGVMIPSTITTSGSSCGRRNFMRQIALVPTTALFWRGPKGVASARGLVSFPCKVPLGNTYHFLRAGQSLLEADDIWTTNPLFITNREAALSELGIEQVEETCRLLKAKGINPTIVRYCLAANAVDTANIVGRELRVGRDRLVPEFNFMDPRAIGKWDTLPLSSTEPAVWAMDAEEGGPSGTGGRPPPNEDSTPHETLADQVIRLRQLLSVLETQYSGDTILLVFPDGTGPALLTALIGGIPLNRVHELEFSPGEVRFNITMDSAISQLPDEPLLSYKEVLDRGKQELKVLREKPDEIMNVKDRKYEEERRRTEEEQAMLAKVKEERALAKQKTLRDTRMDGMGSNEVLDQDAANEFGDNSLPLILVSAGVLTTGVAALSSTKHDVSGQQSAEDMMMSMNRAAANEVDGNAIGGALANGQVRAVDETDGDVVKDIGLDGAESPQNRNNVIIGSEENISNDSKSANQGSHADPYREAEDAMQEYLNRDDGGEAWLGMLSELMSEDGGGKIDE